MHRRGRAPVRSGFLVAIVSAVAALVIVLPASAAMAVTASAPDEPEPTARPPVTVSDFIPEDVNLSDCVGLVEKPGCGSKARGGWRQTAIFAAIVVGLGVIVWRITAGLRANRAGGSDSRGGDTERTPSSSPAPPSSSPNSPSSSSPPSPPSPSSGSNTS